MFENRLGEYSNKLLTAFNSDIFSTETYMSYIFLYLNYYILELKIYFKSLLDKKNKKTSKKFSIKPTE